MGNQYFLVALWGPSTLINEEIHSRFCHNPDRNGIVLLVSHFTAKTQLLRAIRKGTDSCRGWLSVKENDTGSIQSCPSEQAWRRNEDNRKVTWGLHVRRKRHTGNTLTFSLFSLFLWTACFCHPGDSLTPLRLGMKIKAITKKSKSIIRVKNGKHCWNLCSNSISDTNFWEMVWCVWVAHAIFFFSPENSVIMNRCGLIV